MCSCCFNFNQCFCPLYFTIKGFKGYSLWMSIFAFKFLLVHLQSPASTSRPFFATYVIWSNFRCFFVIIGFDYRFCFEAGNWAFATLYRALWLCQNFWPGTPVCFLYTVISLQWHQLQFNHFRLQEPMINQSSSWLLIAPQSNFNLYHESTTVTQCSCVCSNFRLGRRPYSFFDPFGHWRWALALGMASPESDRARSRSRPRTPPDPLSKAAGSRPQRPFTPALAEVHTIMSLIREVEEHRSFRMNGLVGAAGAVFFVCFEVWTWKLKAGEVGWNLERVGSRMMLAHVGPTVHNSTYFTMVLHCKNIDKHSHTKSACRV